MTPVMQANGILAKGGLNPRQAEGAFRRVRVDGSTLVRDDHHFVKRQRLDGLGTDGHIRHSNETVPADDVS